MGNNELQSTVSDDDDDALFAVKGKSPPTDDGVPPQSWKYLERLPLVVQLSELAWRETTMTTLCFSNPTTTTHHHFCLLSFLAGIDEWWM
jgi:hypothetical protein